MANPPPVTTYPFPLMLGLRPKEGPKGASIVIPWASAANPFQLNLLSQFQTGNFSTPQAIWIDNSSCPFPIVVNAEQEDQNLWVPATSQGMYPLLAQQAPLITITQQSPAIGAGINYAPAGRTHLTFLNAQQVSWSSSIPLAMPGWQTFQQTGQNPSASVNIFNPAQAISSAFTGKFLISLTGFLLTIACTAAWPATSSPTIFINQAGAQAFWWDSVTVQTGTVGVVYRFAYQFPNPIILPGGLSTVIATINDGPVGNLTFQGIVYYQLIPIG